MTRPLNDERGLVGISWEAPPPDFYDPVIEAYKRDVDRTLLRENLRLSIAERFERFDRMMRLMEELRKAGENHRSGQSYSDEKRPS